MKIETAQFSGPLDLLLQLVRDKKLPITELSISEVTEQYINYIELLEETEATELADFLSMASRLLLMKSRMLLPQFFPEEEDEQSLAEQLKLYKAFIDASKKVNKMWLAAGCSYFRREPLRKTEGFVPPENCTAISMSSSMKKLVHRIAPLKPLPKLEIDRSISIKVKIRHFKQHLANLKEIYFHEVISQKNNRSETIVSFLAILELVKQRTVSLSQNETFGYILVKSEF